MTTREEKKAALLAGLPQFHGTETWFRHALNRYILYTEGVQFVAETAGAYWLLDLIVLENTANSKLGLLEEFQVWKLTVDGTAGRLVCEDGDYNVVHSQGIQYTDFPLDSFELWFENNVIMLPSER